MKQFRAGNDDEKARNWARAQSEFEGAAKAFRDCAGETAAEESAADYNTAGVAFMSARSDACSSGDHTSEAADLKSALVMWSRAVEAPHA